jgi:hypothetical protein
VATPPTNNAFGFTENARNAPPSRKVLAADSGPTTQADDYTRMRTQPDDRPLNAPGERPTKQIQRGPQGQAPQSGLESAMGAMADKMHPRPSAASSSRKNVSWE